MRQLPVYEAKQMTETSQVGWEGQALRVLKTLTKHSVQEHTGVTTTQVTPDRTEAAGLHGPPFSFKS
jgi:hypothetical protein